MISIRSWIVEGFKKERVLIKLGGALLDEPRTLARICREIAHLHSHQTQVILVHGGGSFINRELSRRGISWEFVDGLRVTTPEMIEVIEMVLSGRTNRLLVRFLLHEGLSAIGLSGVDAKTLECRPMSSRLGLVGQIETVNLRWIQTILDQWGLPVLAPLGVGKEGEVYNVNADVVASELALALVDSGGLDRLIFLTDQEGILNERKELLSCLDEKALEDLISRGVVTGGMLAKVNTIIQALRRGIPQVHVLSGRESEALFSLEKRGTLCLSRRFGAPIQVN